MGGADVGGGGQGWSTGVLERPGVGCCHGEGGQMWGGHPIVGWTPRCGVDTSLWGDAPLWGDVQMWGDAQMWGGDMAVRPVVGAVFWGLSRCGVLLFEGAEVWDAAVRGHPDVGRRPAWLSRCRVSLRMSRCGVSP